MGLMAVAPTLTDEERAGYFALTKGADRADRKLAVLLFELGTRYGPSEARQMAAVPRIFLTQQGFDPTREQVAATKKDLEFYSQCLDALGKRNGTEVDPLISDDEVVGDVRSEALVATGGTHDGYRCALTLDQRLNGRSADPAPSRTPFEFVDWAGKN